MKSNFRQAIFTMLVAFGFGLSLCATASAQDVTGSINGTVRDASGAVVSGATVTIVNPSQNDAVVRTLTTNESGEFSAPNLQSGVYQITAEAANFKKSVQTSIKVDVGQRRSVDFALEAGNITETVTVEADAVAVNLTTPTADTTINGDQVRELSINNRNFVQLLTLSPGVSGNLSDQVYVGTTNPDGQANTVSISVNGARSSQNTYTVDGADITDRGSNLTIQAYPSVDSIGEFKVLRSLYPAESGRSGGGQVNIITRSGTDQFHGSLFEFVRNEKFNANTFINNRTLARDADGKAIRPPFRYNNYGFTLGGPIYFLKFGEREPGDSAFGKVPRTYFFFSEEQRKDRRFPSLNSTVPDAGLRNGVFPVDICLAGTIVSTTSRTCQNILPAGTPLASRAAISPVSQAYLNIYRQLPLPNNPNFSLFFPTRNTFDFRQEILKIDTAISEKLSAYYRFENDKIPTLEANSLFSNGTGLPGVATTQTDSPGRTHTFQADYTVSSNFIIEGRYTHAYGAILSRNVGLLSNAVTSVPVSLAYPNQRDRIPTLTGTGFSGFAGFGPYDNFSNKNDFSGNVTYILGSHTTKFGGSFSKYRKNENALAGNNEGVFSTFYNTANAATAANQGVVCAPSQQVTTSGVCLAGNPTIYQTFANFLLGTNATFSQAKADYTANFYQRNFDAFAQDEYRVRKNLTLYYGVRYSFFGSPYDAGGLLTNFVPELYNQATAPTVDGNGNRVVGTGNFCNGLIVNTQNYQTAPNGCTPIRSPYGKYVVKAPKKNFAPRVGLAFDPFGDGRTSIRMGYGIYHEQTLVGIFEQNLISNPPYQETTSLNNINLSQSFATNPLATLGVIAVRGEDTDWKTPYMQHWSFDVQHQFFKNTLVDVGYYGSKGTNLIGIVDINLLKPGEAINRGALGCATGTSTTPTTFCQAPNTALTSSTILQQIRPYRGYSAINIIKPAFDSNYHSLQVAVTQRFAGASQINVAYTFAKNLTNSQTDRSTAPQNSYDFQSESGRAQLDRRHVFVSNFIYELPFFRGERGLVPTLLGGFQTSGILTLQTGIPFTVTTAGYDPAGIGFLGASAAGPRPIQYADPFIAGPVAANPDPRCQLTLSQGGFAADATRTATSYYNRCAFQTLYPTSGVANVVGNSPRGVLEGPGTTRLDLSLMKNFRFTETVNLQLRGEMFNVFNTTNFSGFSSTSAASTVAPALFGAVSATRDPRSLQLGIKFLF